LTALIHTTKVSPKQHWAPLTLNIWTKAV